MRTLGALESKDVQAALNANHVVHFATVVVAGIFSPRQFGLRCTA